MKEWRIKLQDKATIVSFFFQNIGSYKTVLGQASLRSSNSDTLYSDTYSPECQDKIWDTGFYTASGCTADKNYVLYRPNIGKDFAGNVLLLKFYEIRLY